MSRNGDIRGFFGRPSAAGPDPGSSMSKPATSSQPVPDLQPSPPISSPWTPPKPTPKLRDRTDEIKGSDDEEGDSDDSLESISAFYKRKNGPAPYERDLNVTSTPKAKRIASSTTLKSPLTILPKPAKHKFDLKFLANHAKQSDRADESARIADELINQSDNDSHDGEHLKEVQNDPALLEKTAKDLLDSDEEDAKGGKLMRAMNRTRVDGSHRVCYFFEQPLCKPPRRPFPQKRAKGCWKCLANSRTRDQTVILGLPHAIAAKGNALPDELFLWILNEVCAERNAQLRVQYCNLVSLCHDSISRLVTDAQLYSMLHKLGGPNYVKGQHGTKLQGLPKVEDPYPKKDWAGLVTFLELLERMAPNLSTENAIGAIQLLLRMGLDPIVSTTVRGEHAAAMEALAGALPKLGTGQWDDACYDISAYLNAIVDKPVDQVVPISHMPKTSTKLLDLRRRMAAVALFQDEDLGGQAPDSALTLDDITSRLDAADFRIGASTDFEALRALVTLLDVVIGPAGFLYPPQHSRSDEKQDDADRRFDADVDALTFRLKMVHDKIHDSTLLSRKVAKASIDLVAKRLTYAVRTRPPPKTSIFDPEPSRREDAGAPKQRAFMKNWALKKAVRGADADGNGNGNENGNGHVDGIE